MSSRSYSIPMGALDQEPQFDINVKRMEGTYIFDTFGKKYLDLRSGLWNVSLGYNVELYAEIEKAFSEIFKKGIPFLDIHSYQHEIYNEYADALLDFINNNQSDFSKIFYTNSGSEGTELSIKLIRQFAGKEKIILSFREGYHGTFFGGMSVSGIDQEITEIYEPKINNIEFKTYPTDKKSLENILAYLTNNADKISAFLLEPIIGSSGTLTIPNEYLNSIMKVCKENDILIVFDEVATGFYRTGSRFKYYDLNYAPDILILSKAINNGILPFGVVAINEKIINGLQSSHIEHFSTQNGNILGISSALQTLSFYRKYESLIVEQVKKIESLYGNSLNSKNIEFRGQGSMLSIPLKDLKVMYRILDRLKNFGVLTYYYNSPTLNECGLTIFPPLLIEEEKLKKALYIIIKSIEQDY
ncbi:aminotransferase class III-fold pyridoxal phosphate-dependent enzyme [Bacillus thuringiensis]|uniref:aminotransferase class III-fold pyridoxal phosphate-dependent enzyme n=1 Tax=Bacillus thuringiensis TaxID=1428 RepID=UPI00125F681E|nr:aminotransferase class III-fold pyridoxal phosphate-dependent enzyme [Bacillus thuringiensis]KAB5631360.1 aminotransferase class III-fold pyridoxal phosphate-dependent enzyme [Bacillus thuringiensis]HDR5271852.1 aminotransferase class III-fold pyridoxal phosphate-dependent enzyme [Bacillus thuringiensis]